MYKRQILRRDAPFPEDAALSPEELFEKGLDARHQAMNDAVIELQPVSYTHLDVYKRQV